MKLLVQPEAGIEPILEALGKAKKSIQILIFRLDRPEIEKALVEAVERGVAVQALVAYTNRGGDKVLRRFEMRLLEKGITVTRTADDLVRYHGKMFIVSDVGATFATNNLQLSRASDKGNVQNYQNSKFITHTSETTVDFGTPAAPTGVLIKSMGMMAGDYFKRAGFEWIGRGIPREDAKWVGNLLGQLSQQQLTDAFRAGNFPPETIQGYVDVLEQRITALKAL